MTQQGKKRGFKLDLDDMERRMVEFRVTLDRERRRCQQAQMVDKFEKLLRDKLLEVRNQETPDGQQPNVSTANSDNEIKLATLDDEGSKRLANFLMYTIEMCKRVDQQELMQDVLRKALHETRRKRFKSQQETPSVPLEPFCLFCASSLDSGKSTGPCQDSAHHHQQHIQRPIGERPALTNATFQQGQTVDPDTTIPRVQLVYITPPSSAVPTPEVGEQSRSDTPTAVGLIPNPRPSGQPPAASYTPTIGVNKQLQQLQKDLLKKMTTTTTTSKSNNNNVPAGSSSNHRELDTPITTNASSAQQAPQSRTGLASAAAATAATANSAAPATDFVMPTDDEDDTSEDDDNKSVRNVLNAAAVRASSISLNRNGGDSQDLDERRCSTPINDQDGSEANLVIDESTKIKASPIKKPPTLTRSSSGQQQSKSVKLPVTRVGNRSAAADTNQQLDSTTHNNTSVANMSQLEESSQYTRSQGNRKKTTKRRNLGNKRP